MWTRSTHTARSKKPCCEAKAANKTEQYLRETESGVFREICLGAKIMRCRGSIYIYTHTHGTVLAILKHLLSRLCLVNSSVGEYGRPGISKRRCFTYNHSNRKAKPGLCRVLLSESRTNGP